MKTAAYIPHAALHGRRFSVIAGLLALALLLAGCAPPNQLGGRPAASVQESAEIYLQRYQPGPLPRIFESTHVVDRHGAPLAELWEEGRRTWVPLEAISQHLIDATIATEDATFYVNLGVDPARIAGAALQNAQQGGVVSGASTITMQLARNLFLGPDSRYAVNMDRKMLEAGLAQELTSLFSKDELLEMYLNLLNYGHLAYGPEAASQVYFAKPAAELTLAEATLLAGIPQQPANLDPLRNFDAARARQRIVLDLMVRHGKLTQAQADAVYAEPISLNPDPDRRVVAAPHFVQYVAQQAQPLAGEHAIARSGLLITTTLDLSMHSAAQEIVAARVAQLQPQFDLSNAALVAIKPGSSEILVMVGSADFADRSIDGQVNVATSPRQPGSAIKPILYATAFEDTLISPASVIWDVPVTYTVSAGNVYIPANYDRQFHGPVTARTALASSYNVPAVKLLDAVGVGRMLESAQAMGLRSLTRDQEWYGLSLTLGGGEVTLLDLTTAFATLANAGTYVEPTPFLAVADGQGRAVSLPRSAVSQALSPAAAFQVTDILADNAARAPAFGANSPLRLSQPAAVKTGTTTDWRDNWTVGYTPDLVGGVWVGNADNTPMLGVSGVSGAGPIWRDVMEMAHKGLPATRFRQPDGLVRAEICIDSGLLPTQWCSRRRSELFIAGTEPAEFDNIYRPLAVDRCRGGVAGPETTPECVEQRVLRVYPPELREWALAQGIGDPLSVIGNRFPVTSYELRVTDDQQPQLAARNLQPATLTLISPDPNSIFRLSAGMPAELQQVRLAARPVGAALPSEVTFLVNGQPVGRSTRLPFETWWTLQPGAHFVTALALDADGQQVSSEGIWIEVE